MLKKKKNLNYYKSDVYKLKKKKLKLNWRLAQKKETHLALVES